MNDDEKCYATALRILNHRFNSETELRRKLQAKQFERQTVDATVERLRRERWIDDARFAESFVRSRVRKNLGPQRILRELQAAGVEESLAQRALEANLDPASRTDLLRVACERRSRILIRRSGEEYLQTNEGRARLARHLISLGFEPADVWNILRETRRRM